MSPERTAGTSPPAAWKHRLAALGRSPVLRPVRAAVGRWLGLEVMRYPPYPDAVVRELRHRPDYTRYASLALAIHRINEEGIAGSLAELGVWRGETSRFLRRCDASRTLYLFDTFEGFPVPDREAENANDSRFRDTSESHVRRQLGDLERVEIRRGRFPETSAGLESERFALVLLDLDVYGPTLAGLEFFYPRLTPGGYLFLHDFNNPESRSACRRAVREFFADKQELPIEIPDNWGSVIIRRLEPR